MKQIDIRNSNRRLAICRENRITRLLVLDQAGKTIEQLELTDEAVAEVADVLNCLRCAGKDSLLDNWP